MCTPEHSGERLLQMLLVAVAEPGYILTHLQQHSEIKKSNTWMHAKECTNNACTAVHLPLVAFFSVVFPDMPNVIAAHLLLYVSGLRISQL